MEIDPSVHLGSIRPNHSLGAVRRPLVGFSFVYLLVYNYEKYV